MAPRTTGWRTRLRSQWWTTAPRRESRICVRRWWLNRGQKRRFSRAAVRRLLAFEQKGGRQSRERRESGRTGYLQPAGRAMHFSEIGMRMHFHLHLFHDQASVLQQREDYAGRLGHFLHHIGSPHGQAQRFLPAHLIRFGASKGVLIR